MPDTFTVTVIFIILAAAVAAVVRRRTKDKCLKDFAGFIITLEKNSGKTAWGRLNVENTGLELVFPQTHKDQNAPEKTSYLLYKYEFPNITALVRYHDQLSEDNKSQRDKQLEKTYHPGLLRRTRRKILNIFKTVRDSVIEIINLLLTQAKRTVPGGTVLASQDKYVSAMKQELTGSIGTSYEPLFEKYIGRKVILEIIKGDKILEYCGVLKDYTADFIEILDADYTPQDSTKAKKADLVVSRKCGIVRHLGE
jgi:hypothetical protein